MGDRDAADPLPVSAAARLRAGSTGSNGDKSRDWERGTGESTRDPASWRWVLAGGVFLTGHPRLPPGGSAAAAHTGQPVSLRAAPPAPPHPGSGARGEKDSPHPCGKTPVRGHPTAPGPPSPEPGVPSGRRGGGGEMGQEERGGRAGGGCATPSPPHGPGRGAHPEGTLGMSSPKPAPPPRLGFGTPGLFSAAPGAQLWGADGPAEGLTSAWSGVHSPPGKLCR